MAEEVKESGRMVVVKLTSALGDNPEGSCINVPEEAADQLVSAGLAQHAKADDMGAEVPEEGIEEVPMVAKAVNRLTQKVEKAVGDTVAKTMNRLRPAAAVAPMPTIAAQVKSEPAIKTVGQLVRSLGRALYNANPSVRTQESNKVMEYQEKAASAWSDKLGVQVKSILGINETTNSQGGFLVNPEFSKDVYSIPHTQINLLEQCVKMDAKSNLLNQRFVNESSLANGSIYGGLNMVATAEGASFTSSLPAWSNVTLQLFKEAIFLYYTNEVLEDAAYPIEAEVNEYVLKAFLYGLNTQVIQGSTLEGALNTPALVTVTSSSNDTAFHSDSATCLTYADLSAMWAQVYPDSKASPKGMWLYHPSLEASLTQMTYTFSGDVPAWGLQYNAQQGLDNSGNGPLAPYTIFSRPAYACWAMSAPGTAGDIMYVDFGTFRHYQRPFRLEVSKEFQFGTDQVAVRAVNRLDCKTIFRNKVTGPTGTQQFSAIVTRSAVGT